MNLLLSDDYILQEYPEHITSTIRSGHSTCVRFSRKGDLLASGRADGTVVIWDLETMGVARKLRGHSKNISSLSWSRCGRYLLSACQDWKAILWDLRDGKRHREVRFRAPVYMADLHPWSHLQFTVALFEEQPLLVDITEPIDVRYVLPSVRKRNNSDADAATREKQAKEDAKHMTTAILYTASGDHILAGTNKGRLNILDAKTRDVVFSERIAAGIITTLQLTESGSYLLVNAQDRIIRTFHMPAGFLASASGAALDPDTIQITLEHKFQDVVNRLSWNHVAFSATGEYVAASTYNNHELYIWERGHGSLVRMLEGPKEEQGTIEWHPHKALLAACGLETGRINIWSVTSPQRWSALAPDFVEVEENVEYVEHEDEFDIHPQEEIQKRRLDAEDEEVDVLSASGPGASYGGSGGRFGVGAEEDGGEDQDEGVAGGHRRIGSGKHAHGGAEEFRMPILFNLGDSDSEEEFVNVSLGTLRRKSPGEHDDGEATGEEKPPAAKKPAKGRTRRR